LEVGPLQGEGGEVEVAGEVVERLDDVDEIHHTTLVVSTTILLVVSMVSVVPVVWHGRGVARSVVVHCGV